MESFKEKFDTQKTKLIHESRSTQIFQTINLNTKTEVIVKLPMKKFPSYSEIENFKKEFQFGRMLFEKFPEHFGKFIQLLETESTIAIVQEPIGVSLEKILSNNGKFGIKEFLETAIDITEGLIKLHSVNIIHRDLKPSNVIKTEEKKFKIIDFGVSVMVSRKSPSIHCNNPVGTFSYMR
jgi:serine/threonine protein kinase